MTYPKIGDGSAVPRLPGESSLEPLLDQETWDRALQMLTSAFHGPTAPDSPLSDFKLPEPLLDIDSLTQEMLLAGLVLSNETATSQKETMELHRKQLSEWAEKSANLIMETFRKQMAALEEQKKEKVANVIKAAFMFVGAVLLGSALTALSGGTLAVAAAGCVAGALMALVDLVGSSVKLAEVKAPDGSGKVLDISIAAGVRAIVESLPETKNLPPEEREEAVRKGTMAVTIILTVVIVAGGLAGVAGPAAGVVSAVVKDGLKFAEALKTAAKETAASVSKLEAFGEVGGAVAEIGDAIASLMAATFKMKVADTQRDANDAKADAAFAAALVEYVGKLVSRDTDTYKQVVAGAMDRLSAASDLVMGMGEYERNVLTV